MDDDEFLSTTRRLHRDALVRIQVGSYLKASEPLQRFSNYLLAGTGAFLALFVANIQGVESLIGPQGIRLVIASSLASIFCGLLARFYALRIDSALAVSESLEPAVAQELKRHRQLLEKYIAAGGNEAKLENADPTSDATVYFARTLPWWQRPKLGKQETISALEPIVTLNSFQQALTFFQAILAFVSLVIVALYV